MADVVSPAKHSQMMSGIKGENSLPEMLVRKALFAMAHRFRLHRRALPDTPDIAVPGRKIAIFVHGCFWHAHQACKCAKTLSARTGFWTAKLQGNVDRDRRAADKLGEIGCECSTSGNAPCAIQWLSTASQRLCRLGSTAARPRARSAPRVWRRPVWPELGGARYNATSAFEFQAEMQPLIETLVRESSEGLHVYLTEEQMQSISEGNHAETAPGACHQHDFCDSNMLLYEVFVRHGMDPAAEVGMGSGLELG